MKNPVEKAATEGGEGEKPLDDIERRILDATLALATEGGYEAVRQRDVARRAGVALGTLYARFEGKDALLAAALQQQAVVMVADVRARPLDGQTPLSRVTERFAQLTDVWLERPQLARAALRATASGDPHASMRLMHAQQGVIQTVARALRGSSRAPQLDWEPAFRIAAVLVMVWFANLTAWAGGLATEELVVEVVRQSADMLLHGVPHLA